MEGEYIIGAVYDGQSVTIEPGGQFELSGAPVDTLHKTCSEVNSHLYQVCSMTLFHHMICQLSACVCGQLGLSKCVARNTHAKDFVALFCSLLASCSLHSYAEQCCFV